MMDGKDIRVLIINGSPRRKSNTAQFVAKASEGAKSVGAKVVEYTIAGKNYEHCRETCRNYHARTGNCIIDDDLHELANEWIRADGIIYAVPVFHMGMPSAMNAIITRIGAIVFGHSKGKVGRFLKAGGVITQGNTQYGGQEIVMEYINAHLLLMNCIPVTSDKPESYIGVAARVRKDGTIARNDEILESTYQLGIRIVEMARIIKSGKEALGSDLPDEYIYDKDRTFSAPQKRDKKG